MADTFDKLQEAKFFFEQMNNCQTDRTGFKYNLSAFLSAFRSITFVMQKEYSKIQDFENWYQVKQEELKSNDRMKLLDSMRVITIHKTSIHPRAQIYASIEETVWATDEIHAVVIHADGTVENSDLKNSAKIELPPEAINTPKELIDDKWLWFFKEYPKTDIMTICNECLILMGNIVSECELKFALK